MEPLVDSIRGSTLRYTMPEVSGTEFLKAHGQFTPDTREFTLEDGENRQLTVTLTGVDRKELFDELNKLSSGFIELMMSGNEQDLSVEDLENVDDPSELGLDVDPGKILSEVDGSTIEVFENLFARSASHEDLTSLDMETLAGRLSFEVLFEAGGEVIDLSLQDPNRIRRFRGAE